MGTVLDGRSLVRLENVPNERNPQADVGDVFPRLVDDVPQPPPGLVDPILHLRSRTAMGNNVEHQVKKASNLGVGVC